MRFLWVSSRKYEPKNYPQSTVLEPYVTQGASLSPVCAQPCWKPPLLLLQPLLHDPGSFAQLGEEVEIISVALAANTSWI